MKILNFGSCNIDYVYSLDHIVREGETQKSVLLEVFAGGKGLNQSIAAAKAGAQIYHAGFLGEDGAFLKAVLEDSGVDTTYLRTAAGKNGHAVIQVAKNGQNSIFLYPGSNEMLTKEYIDSVLSDFSKGDTVMLQNEVNLVDYIVDRAHERGMQILFNPSPFNDGIASVDLQKVTYLILNEVEAWDITGCRDPQEAIDLFHNRYPSLKVMLTLGGEGCIFADKGKSVSHPAFRVTPVDTTAAGDTFTGYFAYGVTEGKAIKETLALASLAAAISVTRKGAAPSIPCMHEVLEYREKV